MRSRRLASIGLSLAALLAVTPAFAGGGDFGADMDINPFRPAMDSRGYITVNASQVLGHKELSFGLVTNWGKSMLTFEQGDNFYEVQNVISPTLIAAMGFKAGLEFEIGLSIPFNIMSGDRGPDDNGGTPTDPNDDSNFKFEGQGLGDIGLHVKTRFLNTSRGRKIGLAVIASVYLPTSTESGKWLGDEGVLPQLLGVVDKEFGETGRLRVAFQTGFRLRTKKQTFVDNSPGIMGAPNTGKTLEAGPTIPFGVGVALALKPQKFDVVGEIFGEIPVGGENYFPLEAIAGIKVYLAKNSFLSLGGGVGLLPDKGGNPDIRAFLGIVFEPSIGDRDGDGLKDDIDKCPDDPEDFDDFEDSDGCPEPDNDLDGILDVDDKCPLEPEDKDGFEDEDGCPEGNKLDRDGDGILDDVDKCPDDPEDKDQFEDEDGCPDEDNDQDGILDVDDLCPDDPEDKDGFKDQDGCPDTDNDGDRILDKDDQCPGKDGEAPEDTKETYNGVDDEDGCPDRGRVVVTDTKIEILDKVYFEFNRAVIKKQSFPILDAVAATLIGNPDIQKIEIQGHTDERGSAAYNRSLSGKRVAAVKRYLERKGVAGDRLESQGYGEDKPVDTRHNEQAWAKNRRVEFLILKRAN